MIQHYPFTIEPLPFDYDALEPYIDAETMQLHHDKHLQRYIDNLNDILKDYENLQQLTLEQLIYYAYRLPKSIQLQVKNNAGGVYNHEFFFDELTDNPALRIPYGNLEQALIARYNSIDDFESELKSAALSVFGSGYAWLVVSRKGTLRIITTVNQNTPLTDGLCPILNIDVWEHAYYLKHNINRSAYIDDLFRVLNWKVLEERFNECNSSFKYYGIN